MEIDRELILQSFIVESGEHLSEMEKALILLEAQPDDVETLQTIFRVVHTIKGSAGCLSLRKLTDFAHVLEDLLDRLRTRTLAANSPLIKVLLTSVDVLRQMTADAAAGIDQMEPWQSTVLNQILEYDPDESGEVPEEHVSKNENRKHETTRIQKSGAQTLRIGLDKLDHMLTLTGRSR
jgi:two-component system chemotaxis sensor kinase CheA